MKRTVRFEEEAARELLAAAVWYEERRTALGTEFLDAVDATIEQVLRFPGAGAAVPKVPTDVPVRRAPVKRFPYSVVYLQVDAVIRILAIAHDGRRPRYWTGRA